MCTALPLLLNSRTEIVHGSNPTAAKHSMKYTCHINHGPFSALLTSLPPRTQVWNWTWPILSASVAPRISLPVRLTHGIQHIHRHVGLTNGASHIVPTIPTAVHHRPMPINEASNTAPRAAFQRPSFTAPTTPTADHHRQYKINNLRLI